MNCFCVYDVVTTEKPIILITATLYIVKPEYNSHYVYSQTCQRDILYIYIYIYIHMSITGTVFTVIPVYNIHPVFKYIPNVLL